MRKGCCHGSRIPTEAMRTMQTVRQVHDNYDYRTNVIQFTDVLSIYRDCTVASFYGVWTTFLFFFLC